MTWHTFLRILFWWFGGSFALFGLWIVFRLLTLRYDAWRAERRRAKGRYVHHTGKHRFP